MDLPLLDAICRETLRLYAPLPYRNRMCVQLPHLSGRLTYPPVSLIRNGNSGRTAKEAVIPLANGSMLHVPAGTEILVNCHGLNTDPAVWGTDAQQWRPERWFEPLPKVHIPGVYAHS